MGRYVKRSRPEPDDASSARYWTKVFAPVAAWQALMFLVPFMLSLSAEGLATVGLIAVIVGAIWLRRNARLR